MRIWGKKNLAAESKLRAHTYKCHLPGICRPVWPKKCNFLLLNFLYPRPRSL